MTAWAERQVYWATLAYARWWMGVDGPFLGAVHAARGFTPPLLRRVAVKYNVNRGLLQSEDGEDTSAPGLIELLNIARNTWPKTLSHRAEACVKVALDARRHGYTDSLQVSGISKFMWFLEPDRWTLFDRFAAAGMGVPSHWSRERQFEAFYRLLGEAGFEDVIRDIEPIAAQSCLPRLPASRIVDSLLMARGQRGSADHEVEESRAFLALLPKAFRDDLHDLAATLQRRIGNAALPAATKRKKYQHGA